jgi:hypothetical protein
MHGQRVRIYFSVWNQSVKCFTEPVWPIDKNRLKFTLFQFFLMIEHEIERKEDISI